MFSRSTYALVAALFAAIALFGSAATASAGEYPEAASTADGSHRPPNIDPGLLPIDHPAYAVLQNLLERDLLPRPAADVLRRVSDAHADRVAPGFACDRIAATDLASGAGTELRERCRAELGDGANVFALCRRAVNADHVDPTIIERCRTLLAGHSDGSDRDSLAEACHRLAHSDAANEELAKRCRNAFDGDGGEPDPIAGCRRLAQSGQIAEHPELAKHCRNLSDGHDTQEGPHTDIERRERTPREADHATDPRVRLDAAGVALRTPAH